MEWASFVPASAPADTGGLSAAASTSGPSGVSADPSPRSCLVVSDAAEAERLRPQWKSLLEHSIRSELMLSPDWLLTWWRVYGGWQGRQLRLGLFHDAGRLIGLAPLLRRWHWHGGQLPFRRLELLASGEPAEHGIYSNHLSILSERGAEEQVAVHLTQALHDGVFGSWDEVVLPMMPGDTPIPGLLVNAFRAAGIPAEVSETAQAPYITLPTTWEAYLQSLSRGSRRQISRSLKALEAWAGATLHLERVTTAEDLERGKAILMQLHRARWKHDGKCGVFRSPFYLQFHELLMRRLLQEGNLELYWLRAHGQPLAALYGMAWNGKIYAYQTGRRADLPGNLRPGFVLLVLMIRRAIETGRREFDLLADDMFYKRQLAPVARPLLRIRAVRNPVLESMRRGSKACLRFLAQLRSF